MRSRRRALVTSRDTGGRTAILIGSSGSCPRTPGYLYGVEVDKERYLQFLQSPAGGAWRASEIQVLTNPSFAAVLRAVELTRGSAFTLTIFCGRGEHETRTEDAQLYINDRHAIPAYALRTHAPRQMLIADAYRSTRLQTLHEREHAIVAHPEAVSNSEYRRSCRYLYDSAFLAAEEGRSDVYSCKQNESSTEDPREGSLFSQLLVSQSVAWAEASRSGPRAAAVLTLPSAVARVSKALINRRERQTPKLRHGRGLPSLPFAVA